LLTNRWHTQISSSKVDSPKSFPRQPEVWGLAPLLKEVKLLGETLQNSFAPGYGLLDMGP